MFLQVALVPRSEKALVTSHATKADPGYLVELAKEVILTALDFPYILYSTKQQLLFNF